MIEKLIINADDFGLASGVNRGIIECHAAGVLTSTTLMVRGAAAEEAAGLAADHPELGVGLHLNITAGAPVLPVGQVTSLVNRDGFFYDKWRTVLRLSAGGIRLKELEAEVRAQIRRCRELGVEPTHADSHHHIHAHPLMRRIVQSACRDEGISAVRSYHLIDNRIFDGPSGRLFWAPWPLPRSLGPRLNTGQLLLEAMESLAPRQKLASPDRLFGVATMGYEEFADRVGPLLNQGSGTLEIMCHPGYVDPTLEAVSSYTHGREAELRSLLSREMKLMLENSGARLISYRDL